MGKRTYHETLLHWIWQNSCLSGNLETQNGQQVIIYAPGRLNPTDGPDFTGAKIGIGGLIWYGDVEIHWDVSDWFKHKHDTDSNYNSVILHVVFEQSNSITNQTHLPTLFLKPYLKKPLKAFFEQFDDNHKLPCSKRLSFISPAAMEAQIAKAHLHYFEQKVDDILRFYNPELPPSQAWKQLVIIALFDGLGIAHNRELMQRLAKQLLNNIQDVHSLTQLKTIALKESQKKDYKWNKKGSRPANHPEPRISQGCELLWHIVHQPFKDWLNTHLRANFSSFIENVKTGPNIGSNRAGILFGTVWLPACYVLGQLFGAESISQTAKQAWFEHRTALPASVYRPFKNSGIPEFVYQQKLGTVHQLRSFCQARQCHRCEVFKSAISA